MHQPPDPRLSEAARALATDLAASVDGAVRFDPQARAAYASDASHYRRVPLGVVYPRDSADVEAAVAVCRSHGAPVLPRGGGTSLAGQAVNVAVVLDFSRHLHRILEIDSVNRRARIQPGTVLDQLQAAARPHGLRFGPDPSTHASCTLGGMIGNNACGVHSLQTGRTADNLHALRALTYRGQLLRLQGLDDHQLSHRLRTAPDAEATLLAALRDLGRQAAPAVERQFPAIPRRVSGYNLDELVPGRAFHPGRALVGTEGTCALVLEATVDLVPDPAERALVLLGYPTLAAAAHAVPEVLEAGGDRLFGLEGIDHHVVDNPHVRSYLPRARELFPEGRAFLIAELAGEPGEASGAARELERRLTGRTARLQRWVEPDAQALVWRVREAGLGTTSHHPRLGDTGPGWEDSAVAPENLGAYVEDFQRLLVSHGLDAALYGHFGDGCLHARIAFDLTSRAGVTRYRTFVQEAAALVVSRGGSLSGEHGDGRSRGELLPRMYGPEILDAFRAFRRLWDPDGLLNPGVGLDGAALDAHLRPTAPRHRPALEDQPDRLPVLPQTAGAGFALRQDGGDLARAANRCVGVGNCRRMEDGVMCPSYRATRAEEHSTRGRARLLAEMLLEDRPATAGNAPATQNGLAGGFASREVLDALDLCLACKGCKKDCPTSVDMATLKAEFLARHYRRRLRPPAAWLTAFVGTWARIGSRLPRQANALAASGVGTWLAARVGLVTDRPPPELAEVPFRRQFEDGRQAGRVVPGPAPGDGARRLVLWPDTFNDFFSPGVATAAVDVLHRLGWAVELPRHRVCCGRPLYDWGFLGLARKRLRAVLDVLAPQLAAGLPVVVLEPSCLAVFRDELPDLLPDDPRGQRLAAQACSLAELFERHELQLPTASAVAGAVGEAAAARRVLLHGHCHQKSVLGGMAADRRLLERTGWQVHEPEPGCCGMAGAFGFRREHAEVARRVGEADLLPAVREAPEGQILVADGFSCREQIRRETDRRALHLAELLHRSLAHQHLPR